MSLTVHILTLPAGNTHSDTIDFGNNTVVGVYLPQVWDQQNGQNPISIWVSPDDSVWRKHQDGIYYVVGDTYMPLPREKFLGARYLKLEIPAPESQYQQDDRVFRFVSR